jgi:flagellar hook-associated protein 3 FlgL
MFDDLEAALAGTSANPAAGLQAALGNIKDASNQILSVTAEIGAKTNRLQLTESKLSDQLINLTELLSFNEDVSIPEAMMKLAIEENVYNASLAVGARIIQPSLMDFLR